MGDDDCYQVEKASNSRLIGLPEEEGRFKDFDGEDSARDSTNGGTSDETALCFLADQSPGQCSKQSPN